MGEIRPLIADLKGGGIFISRVRFILSLSLSLCRLGLDIDRDESFLSVSTSFANDGKERPWCRCHKNEGVK